MLDATPVEIKERKALRINACKTCQPVGAMYAALGVHNCLPYSHGSHGCVAYHRTVLTRHFKDPIMAASSSFSEGACVFGGKSNLKTGIKNVFDIYNPDIIAVHTTCLSEVIGDDLRAFIKEFDIPEDKTVVYCHTPSFKGSHVDGYVSMMNGFIEQITKTEADPTGKLAIFPAWSEPGDLREIKRMLNLFGIDFTMFPDQSGVVDAPMKDHYEMFPEGGTTLEEIAALGGASKVLGLGPWTMSQTTDTLNKKCDVPAEVLPYPIGIANTDKLVMALAEFSGKDVPHELEVERGQLVDLMVDCHIWTSQKTCAIFGDPDYILGTTELALELGMIPKYVLTGTPGKTFPKMVEEIFERYGVQDQCQAFQFDDLFHLHQLIKNDPVDLLIGTNYGKQIARAEDIPFVRAGWPILDRYGHYLFPTVGYQGGMRFVERIVDQLLDHLDRTVPDEKFDVVL
jgi:nitrogenase molybdenum-iron protein beta chain